MKKMKLVSLCVAATVPAFGVTIMKDVNTPSARTVVLKDFSGMREPASTMKKVRFDSIRGGAAVYTYAAGAGPEGTLTYNTSHYDPVLYRSMRIRMSVSRDSHSTASVQVYPYPVGPAGNVTGEVPSGAAMNEISFDLSGTRADGKGVRIDAFDYANDGTGDRFQIDYIMVDQSRTIGWEFDHDADLQGVSLVNMSSSMVLDGRLSGTASTGDSQIWLLGNGATGPSIDADLYKYVEIRIKGHAGDRIDLMWNTAAKGSLTPKVDVEVSADGEWHTYLLDFSDEAAWTGDVTALRLDPNSAASAAFELDYVRFMERIDGPAAQQATEEPIREEPETMGLII